MPFFEDGFWWLPVSLLLFLSIMPLVFPPRGRCSRRRSTARGARGDVTPELGGAFADPAVAFARRYEVVVVAVILALMVLKPF